MTTIQIGKAIKKERLKQKMTLYQLRKQAKVGGTQLDRIESGQQSCSIDTLVSILDVLGLKVTVTKK